MNSISQIVELQRSLNSQLKPEINSLHHRIGLILNQGEQIFPGSSLGYFPFDAQQNLFDLSKAITNEMDISTFPEMLSREAALRRQLTISNDLPPSLFLPEGSVMIGCPLLTGNELLGVLVIDLHERIAVSIDQKMIINVIGHLICSELRADEDQKSLRTNLERKSEELIQLRKCRVSDFFQTGT